MRAAFEQAGIELLGTQVGRDAAVGGHRPAAVDADERDDRSGPACDNRAADVDSVAGEPRCGRPTGLVVGSVADEPSLAAQFADPSGYVRGLAAWPELRHRIRVGTLGERLREADNHVEEQVAETHDHAYDPPMDEESRRSRTRSFLVGAAVGASAAIAAARRLRPKERKRETPAGLAAFEEAPCYRELVESERLAP